MGLYSQIAVETSIYRVYISRRDADSSLLYLVETPIHRVFLREIVEFI